MADSRLTPSEAIQLAKDNNVQMVDLKFTDLPGTLQHLSLPISELTDELFAEGTGFDGSSIRGFQTIDESDMLLVPDAGTAAIDPVFDIPTLSLLCDVRDPVTGGGYSRDPRSIAHKAEAHLVSSGAGDVSYWGPEPEFFIFDLGSIRPERPQRLLLRRLGRGHLELGSRLQAQRGGARPGLSASPQGRLLPRATHGYADRPAV